MEYTQKDIEQLYDKYVAHTYGRFPMTAVSGKGAVCRLSELPEIPSNPVAHLIGGTSDPHRSYYPAESYPDRPGKPAYFEQPALEQTSCMQVQEQHGLQYNEHGQPPHEIPVPGLVVE